jgi:microcystin-dependent protein
MSEPFLAEIRPFGFNFAPRGWAQCDGQILPINQNQSLYSLLGTTYGGDGRTTFALPDLRGRLPLHDDGGSFRLGSKGGSETVTLTIAQIPPHIHPGRDAKLRASSNPATATDPTGGSVAAANVFSTDPPSEDINSDSYKDDWSNTGGGQAHDNLPPFMAINFCIALQGLFPPRN